MNKLLVLTGGTKGIGLAINRRFAAAGFDLITCSRSEKRLSEMKEFLAREYPGTAVNCVAADLSNKDGAVKFIEFVASFKRPVDVMINNAGIFLPGQVHNEPEGNLELLMNLNVFSPYYIIRGLVGDMIKNNTGHVFNICSTASITAYTNGGAYCISKFALYGMTRVLREELKNSGIRVTAVLPGATFTESWKGTDLPEERFMKPMDVAEAVFNAWTLSNSSVVEEIIIRPMKGDI